MLEPYEGKLSSTVLRGERGRKAPDPLGAKAVGYKEVRSGSVCFNQRFGSAINLNPHFHNLQVDGAYTNDESSDPRYTPESNYFPLAR